MKFNNETICKIAKNSITNWARVSNYKERVASKILNIMYLDGNQWIFYNRSTGKFEGLQTHENVPKVTANMFVPYVESVKSRVLSFKPTPIVAPLTRDWGDRMLALSYQKMLQGVLHTMKFDGLQQDNIDAMLVCGGSFLLPYWSKEKNEIDVDILNTITCYIDPIAKKTEKARYICFFDVKSTEWINETYGKNYKADNLETVLDGWYLDVYKEQQGITARGVFSDKNSDAWINDANVVVKVFFKEGKVDKMAYVSNIFKTPEVLEIITLEANLVYFHYYRNFFSQEGRTPLTGLRGIQRDINQMLTRLKADFSKREKLLYDARVIDFSENTETFDFGGDEMVAFTSSIPGQAPLQWNPAPPKVTDFSIWKSMWAEAGGQAEASRGNSPTSQASGLLTEMLIEQDETKIGNAKTNLAIGYTQFFKEVNKLIKKHFTKDMVFAIMGRERGWEAVSYAMFKDKDTNFDIQTRIGESMPSSPIQRLNMVLKFAQFGLYSDMPNQFEKLRELADLAYYDFDIVDQHTDKQHAEIEMILNDEDLPGVALWDDHAKHVSVIVQYMNTRDFEVANRKTQQLVMAHLGQHVVIMQSQVPPAPMQGVIPPAQNKPVAQQGIGMGNGMRQI